MAGPSHHVGVANSEASCKESKDQEGLGARLVGNIILDGIRDEVFHLKEYLQQFSNDVSAHGKVVMATPAANFEQKRCKAPESKGILARSRKQMQPPEQRHADWLDEMLHAIGTDA